jgi:hypothetical protein
MQGKELGRPREYDRKAVCFRCGKEFERYPGKQKNNRTFCSRDCYHLQLAEDNLNRRVNQKGGLTFEERLKMSKAHKGKHNGKTYEKTFGRHTHRVVMEKMVGRPLAKGEVVHHIDGNPRNNDPENLMLFKSQSEHLQWHLENDPSYGGDQSHG